MAFPFLSFAYRAFIPQSVGKSMGQIFRQHPHFNRRDLVNYDEFAGFLRRMDNRGRMAGLGGGWIPEPPPVSTLLHTFAMTNDGEFDPGPGARRHTTGKVSIEGTIDLRQIGRMPLTGPAIHVPPTVEAFQCQAAIVAQTTDLHGSPYPGLQSNTGRYVGVFKDSQPMQSIISGRTNVLNKSEGTYFSRPGTSPQDLNDTTILSAKAAGSYPFIRAVAPDIDMQLTVKLRRTGDYVEIRFDGLHDQFPAYELVVDNVRRQRWDPVAHGQTGPNPINLHANYWGTQVRTSFTMYQRLPPGYQPPRQYAGRGLPRPF
jgi:hypothetical protein